MKSIQLGCKFCNDLRNIEPANYISGGDSEFEKFINEAKKKKQFIMHLYTKEGMKFGIVDKCPVCNYKFTEEDYDSYQD